MQLLADLAFVECDEYHAWSGRSFEVQYLHFENSNVGTNAFDGGIANNSNKAEVSRILEMHIEVEKQDERTHFSSRHRLADVSVHVPLCTQERPAQKDVGKEEYKQLYLILGHARLGMLRGVH